MFTGLIETVGSITECSATSKGLNVVIQSNYTDLKLGESIAVDGMCLTVTQINGTHFYCDISSESLSVTIAKQYRTGAYVHLERALSIGARLGGHFVLGHVDEVALIDAILPSGDCREIQVKIVSLKSTHYLVPKGSICLNGVSLTINHINTNGFNLMIIPHTQTQTRLGHLAVGDSVNLEFDYLVKAVHAKMIAKESYV